MSRARRDSKTFVLPQHVSQLEKWLDHATKMYIPMFRIRVILLSLVGSRTSFRLIASTHLASVNKLLLILADSTIRSFWFSVLRLSSDPAKSMADAVLILI